MARLGLMNRLDDRLNPVVVKELRQATRGKMVTLLLILFLAIQLIVSGVYLGNSQSPGSDGTRLLISFLAVLLIAIIILVPMLVGARLGAERSEENLDLLYISTLPPGKIIAGKCWSGLAISGLFVSASLPFMTLTFLLRGVDIPSILFVTLVGLTVAANCLQFSLFVACIPVKRLIKLLLGIVTFFLLVITFFTTLGILSGLTSQGIGGQLVQGQKWVPLVGTFTIGGFLFGLFHMLSVALIKPSSANRALWPRLYLSGSLLLSFVLSATLFSDRERIEIWAVFAVFLCIGCLLVAMCERESGNDALRRTIPKNRWLQLLAFPFYSGSAGGMFWASGCLFLVLASCFGFYGAKIDVEHFAVISGIAMYGFAYILTGHWLYRVFFGRYLRKGLAWSIPVLLLLLFSVGAWVLTFLLFPDDFHTVSKMGNWHLFNPFVLAKDQLRTGNLIAVACWCFFVLPLELKWFFPQVRSFQPLGKNSKLSSPAESS